MTRAPHVSIVPSERLRLASLISLCACGSHLAPTLVTGREKRVRGVSAPAGGGGRDAHESDSCRPIATTRAAAIGEAALVGLALMTSGAQTERHTDRSPDRPVADDQHAYGWSWEWRDSPVESVAWEHGRARGVKWISRCWSPASTIRWPGASGPVALERKGSKHTNSRRLMEPANRVVDDTGASGQPCRGNSKGRQHDGRRSERAWGEVRPRPGEGL